MKRPSSVVYIFAEADEGLQKMLQVHLSWLERQGLMKGWHANQILAGSVQAKSWEEALKNADLVLLLISADFFASSLCQEQMQQALELHGRGEVQVVPILLRRVLGNGVPFAHLQALPSNGKPIASWPDQDEAFAEVAKGILRLLDNEIVPLVSAPQTTLPQIWNIPYPRNPIFLGRHEVLTLLHQQLQGGLGRALSRPQAISGLGGIGKTQIAVEYAYQYAPEYQAFLWARAESKEALNSSYIEIASLLHLSEKEILEQDQVIRAVKWWLQTHRNWLFILDNVDDLALLPEFLPPVLGGHLLLTTRVHALGKIAQRIEVETMQVEMGALFLLRRALLICQDESLESVLPADRVLAMEISQELGGLPLALDQAGAYIEETKCSLNRYIQNYRSKRMSFLKRRGSVVSEHPESVATTWSISFERIEQQNALAIDMLRLCAFLAPDAIPEELLLAEEEKRFEGGEAVAVLGAYSLMQRKRGEDTFSVHRLVQAVLRDTLSAKMRKQWAERAVRIVEGAFPEVEFGEWELCERYLLHALICADWIEQEQIVIPEAVQLLNKVGMYLNERGRYANTERLYQRAIWICEQEVEELHPALASSLNNLALLYQEQGKYAAAEPLLVRVLEIDEQTLGVRHLSTALSMNNLAMLYEVQGKYAKAEPLLVQALGIYEQILGVGHFDTAMSVNNLAVLCRAQGRYAEAELLLVRALEINEKGLGARYSITAKSLNNLAELYKVQERYTEAEPLYKRALKINEQALGVRHPETATSLNNLGLLYKLQEKYAEAEALLVRALEINEQELGVGHPNTATTLNNLAELYKTQEKYMEAEPLYTRALEINEQMLGAEHPETATSLNNLAGLYRVQERYAEAESLYKGALTIWEERLGLQHPTTRIGRSKYITLLRAMGRENEAVVLEVMQQE